LTFSGANDERWFIGRLRSRIAPLAGLAVGAAVMPLAIKYFFRYAGSCWSTLRFEVRLALSAADVIAEGIWTSAHTVPTPSACIPATTTCTADPAAAKLDETTAPGRAVRGRQAAARGARVLIVDHVGVVILKVAAGLFVA
jgi:hypothetical protein